MLINVLCSSAPVVLKPWGGPTGGILSQILPALPQSFLCPVKLTSTVFSFAALASQNISCSGITVPMHGKIQNSATESILCKQ